MTHQGIEPDPKSLLGTRGGSITPQSKLTLVGSHRKGDKGKPPGASGVAAGGHPGSYQVGLPYHYGLKLLYRAQGISWLCVLSLPFPPSPLFQMVVYKLTKSDVLGRFLGHFVASILIVSRIVVPISAPILARKVARVYRIATQHLHIMD